MTIESLRTFAEAQALASAPTDDAGNKLAADVKKLAKQGEEQRKPLEKLVQEYAMNVAPANIRKVVAPVEVPVEPPAAEASGGGGGGVVVVGIPPEQEPVVPVPSLFVSSNEELEALIDIVGAEQHP